MECLMYIYVVHTTKFYEKTIHIAIFLGGDTLRLNYDYFQVYISGVSCSYQHWVCLYLFWLLLILIPE